MTIQSPGAADLPDDFHLAVDRPVAEAKGMPNAAYTSQAYFESERDQLFGKTWAVVGVGIDIPEPGDVKPISFMGLPLVLVRDRAGRWAPRIATKKKSRTGPGRSERVR